MKSRYPFVISIVLLTVFIPPTTGDVPVEEPVVLLTGFGPFADFDTNPSQLIAEALNGEEIAGASVVGIILPVDFEDAVAAIEQAIEDFDPDVVISFGLAANRRLISIEKFGVNWKREPIDEGGEKGRLDPDGPLLLVSTFPTRCIVKHIRKEGIPVRQSWSAGTYVCNAVLYGMLGYISEHDLDIEAGFIHVPLMSSQDPKGMELDTMMEATTIAIQLSLLEH